MSDNNAGSVNIASLISLTASCSIDSTLMLFVGTFAVTVLDVVVVVFITSIVALFVIVVLVVVAFNISLCKAVTLLLEAADIKSGKKNAIDYYRPTTRARKRKEKKVRSSPNCTCTFLPPSVSVNVRVSVSVRV